MKLRSTTEMMTTPRGFCLALIITITFLSIKTNAQKDEDCRTRPMDLVFVVDGSRSVRPWNFKTVQDAIKDMVDTFENIGKDGTRIGLMQYSSTVQTEFKLDEHYTKEDVIEGVDAMKFLAGGTMTGEALKALTLTTFTKEGGARLTQEVLKVAIIITDGRSQDTTVPVWQRRAKDSGIILFAIGVGKRISEKDLLLIASEPKAQHKFYVKNFDNLKTVPVMLNVKICDVNECETGDHNCQHICVNSYDTFTCACREGYVLQEDGFSCVLVSPPELANLKTSEVTHTSMIVDWELDSPLNEKLIDYYSVRYYKSDGSGMEKTVQVKDKTTVLEDLEPGTEYTISVHAYSAGKETSSINGKDTTLFLGKTELTLSDPTLTTLTARWPDAGGDKRTGYMLQIMKESDSLVGGVFPSEELGPDVHEKVFENLEPGVAYKAVVTPVYGTLYGGKGEDTETTSQLVKPDVTVSKTTLSTATVDFTGIGLKCDRFVVTLEPESGSVLTSETPGNATTVLFVGLNSDTEFKVSVTCYVSEGGKEFGSPIGDATGKTKKTLEPIVTVTETSLSTAVVNFTGVGRDCDRFLITLKTATGQIMTKEAAGSESSVLFTGLQPDTDFTVKVICFITEIGEDLPSPNGTAAGRTKRMQTPTVDITRTGLGQADVMWTAGKADEFEVTYFPVSKLGKVQTFETSDISAKLTDLEPDTEYRVEVVAVAYDDDKEFKSDVGGDVDKTKKLVAPTVMANGRTYTTATVKWGDIGVPADGFVLNYHRKDDPSRSFPQTHTGDVNKTTLTGLVHDTEYVVTIVGSVIEGERIFKSPPGSDSFVLGAIDPPDVAINHNTTTSLTSFWTDKVDADNYVITIEEVDGEGKPPVTVDGDIVGRTFQLLTPGTEYKVSVVIQVDDEGTIIESLPGVAYGITKPAPPKNLTAYVTSFTSILVNFDLPIGGYEYFEGKCVPEGTDPKDISPIRVDSNAREFTCDDLKQGERYTVQVVNVLGSPYMISEPAETTALTSVLPPRDFDLSRPTTHSIVATWSPPEDVEEVIEYVLNYESYKPASNKQVRIPGTETTYTLTELHPNTLYVGILTAVVGKERVLSTSVDDLETTLIDTIQIEVVDVSYNNITVSWSESAVPHVISQTLTYTPQIEMGVVTNMPPLTTVIDVRPSQNGYVIDNVKPATIYDIGIQYVYSLGKSEIATTSGTTLAPSPGAPTFTNVTEIEFVVNWGYPAYMAEPVGYTVTYVPSYFGGMVVEENISSGEVLDLGVNNAQSGTEYNVTIVANYNYGIASEPVEDKVLTKESQDEVMCTCSTYLARQEDMQRTVNKLIGVIEKLSAKIERMETKSSQQEAGINGGALRRRGDV